MNFVALALLEACDGDDENAFWILAGMCDRHDLEVRPAKIVLQYDLLVVAASKFRDNLLTEGKIAGQETCCEHDCPPWPPVCPSCDP